MLAQLLDPIIAVATPPGRGAVGIVRVSGGNLDRLVQALFGQRLEDRRATYLPFTDARGATIDRGLAIHFHSPHSYTGEDVLELQAHGGAVVLELVLARCLQAAAAADPHDGAIVLGGLRLAGPGEFTQRAFLNGKLDLAQAEAVADLIDASTEAAARSAGRSLEGRLSEEIKVLAASVVALRTQVEAALDFPEEDIDFVRQAEVDRRLEALLGALDALLERAQQGVLLREGMRVVIAGQPNVGKSSLLNALAGAELAIVTPIPGTTRDKIGQTLHVEGVPMHVVDTAGLRDEPVVGDDVERIGIARSWSAIGEADVVLLMHDLTRMAQPDYAAADARIAQRLQRLAFDPARIVHVYNKADAAPAAAGALAVSAHSGAGLDALRRTLLRQGGWQTPPEGLFMARARHVKALQRVACHSREALAIVRAHTPALELLAEELRLAHAALAEITGVFGVEDLLGEIFGGFCIGK